MDIRSRALIRRLVRFACCAAVFAAVAAPWALQAQQPPAQGYKTIPLPKELENRTTKNRLKILKDQVLLGKLVLDSNRDSMVKWYRDYQFRRLTLPSHFHEFTKIRDELVRDTRSARIPEVHQFLIDTYYNYGTTLCTGNYYPAVRVNAMLLVAGLNQTEENPGARALPIPYAPALKFTLDQLNDPKQLDAIKAVALVGIRRHVQLALVNPNYSISPAQRDSISQATRDIIRERTPPATRTASGHAWMQRRAMETAVMVADLQKDPGLLTELAAILDDDTSDPFLVCATARAVGHLRVPQGLDYDPVPMAQRMGQWVVRAVDREAERVAQEKEAEDRGSQDAFGGLGGLGGMDGYESGGDEEPEDAGSDDPYGGLSGDEDEDEKPAAKDEPKSPPGVLRIRRVLKYQFMYILEGMTGPRGGTNMGLAGLVASDAAKKDEVKKIHDAIQGVLDATDPEDKTSAFKDEDELLKAVQAKLADLEALLPQPEPEGKSTDGEAADPAAATPDAGKAGEKPPAGDTPAGADPAGNDPAGDKPAGGDNGKKKG